MTEFSPGLTQGSLQAQVEQVEAALLTLKHETGFGEDNFSFASKRGICMLALPSLIHLRTLIAKRDRTTQG